MRRHSIASSSPLNDLSGMSRLNPLFHALASLTFWASKSWRCRANGGPETYNTRLTESAQNFTYSLKSFSLDDNKAPTMKFTRPVGLAQRRIIGRPKIDNC